jgi:hypothetical protein
MFSGQPSASEESLAGKKRPKPEPANLIRSTGCAGEESSEEDDVEEVVPQKKSSAFFIQKARPVKSEMQ